MGFKAASKKFSNGFTPGLCVCVKTGQGKMVGRMKSLMVT